MRILTSIMRGFIDFFGITQPSPKQQRLAAWFICSLLALIVLGTTGVFLVVAFSFGK